MNINQIQYFMKVAEEKSFSKAADALFVSRPAVSMQISMLEDEWQVTLFNRKKRVVTLTNSGRILYDYFKSSGLEYKNALKNARIVNRNLKNELHIGVMEGFSRQAFTQSVSQFQLSHPELQIFLEYRPLSALAHEIMDSKYDVILTHKKCVANSPQLNFLSLYHTKLNILISRNHPLAIKQNLQIEDLDGLRVFLRESITEMYSLDVASTIFKPRGMDAMTYTVMANIQSITSSVELGFGIAVLDNDTLLHNEDAIIQLPINEIDVEVVLVWRPENNNPYIAPFLDLVQEKICQAE